MKAYYQYGGSTLFHGDCRTVLRALPAESVHCVVTSPPYWGLRDCGLRALIWGGKKDCVHQWITERVVQELRRGVNLSKSRFSTHSGAKKVARIGFLDFVRGQCQKCGAWRGCYGLEPSPEMYVQHTVLEQGMKQMRKNNKQNRARDAGCTGAEYLTVGWKPDCSCPKSEIVPCTIMDPFHGAGTTWVVSQNNFCRYIGIDLKRDYLEMSIRRQSQPMLQLGGTT